MNTKILAPVLLLTLALAPRASVATAAPDPTVPDPALEQITVRELMRLDAELALDTARRRREQGSPVGASGVSVRARAPDNQAPRLVGIYGVGKRLFAEVRSGTRAMLFLRGHSEPVGQIAGGDQYRLREFSGACIRLERQGEETVLCLPQGNP